MAFVNEYVSEEDINKYNLEEDWISRNPQYLQQGRPSSSPLKWTIDRDRNIYFMVVGGGGREDYDLGMQCIINWQAKVLEISLTQSDGCSKSFTEVPFKIIWELKHIKPSQLDTISHQDIIQVLKEALITYGYAGVRKQIPNAVIEFKF